MASLAQTTLVILKALSWSFGGIWPQFGTVEGCRRDAAPFPLWESSMIFSAAEPYFSLLGYWAPVTILSAFALCPSVQFSPCNLV